ncbi:hypothetical protein ACIP5Y_19785 [Nocardia sp. NPDC088792]|uniref:hypothetical protein n=1 Tax=Nocardia sp. NPDC088792 TaxID=3364332 RepID=UPI003824191E
MPTATSERIRRLRTLIDHPRTGAAERAAAQRMLDRILARAAAETRVVGDRSYGDRHDRPGRHAGLSRIADMIGEDIALARIFTLPGEPGELDRRNMIRDAPAGITYRVESPFDMSIVITVDGVPGEWAGIDDLVAELTALMDAYNHDGTDTGKRFFGTVRVHTAGE